MFKEVLAVIVGIAVISIPIALMFEAYGISSFMFSFLAINLPLDILLILLAIDGYRSTHDFERYT